MSMWALNASLPDVIVDVVDEGYALDSFDVAAKLVDVYVRRRSFEQHLNTVVIRCRLLNRMSTAMTTLRIGSASVHSKARMSMAEMTTPTDPSRSARTCWKAPSTFILCWDEL